MTRTCNLAKEKRKDLGFSADNNKPLSKGLKYILILSILAWFLKCIPLTCA